MPYLSPSLATALAAATLAASAGAQSFQQLTAPLGISGVAYSAPGGTGAGVAVADFDGDGDVDVVVPGPPGAPFRYFRNDGGMQFTDRSAASGLGNAFTVRGVCAADIDNDGDPDLYVANEGGNCALFVNDGTGTFVDQAPQRGLFVAHECYAIAFGDYDRDGWLDLYLGIRTNFQNGQPAANRLYRNTGNGHFVDVTAAAGLTTIRPTLATTFLDYDEDGWPDILVVNDKGDTYGPNELWRNDGDGTFSDVSVATGTDVAIHGMGVDHLDVFNDGGVDFYCTDNPLDHLFQVWDPTTGSYLEATATYGLQGGGIGWAVNWLDYDNDGWQDLHVVQLGFPNLLFRNPAQPAAANAPWTNQSQALGLGVMWLQYAAATADFDDDGRVDLLYRYPPGAPSLVAPDGAAMYRNQVTGGSWLKFRTRGTVSNRDGIGARIEVVTGSHRQRQWVRSGVGYASTSDRRVHFGLGAATSADRVTVTWPSGQVQHLTNVAANQVVDVVEPRFVCNGVVQPGGSATLDLSIPGDQGLPYYMLLSLSTTPAAVLADGTALPVAFDGLSSLTIVPSNPILPGTTGLLDASGAAQSALNIPSLPFLTGLTFYATALTSDTVHFPLVRTAFPEALSITIQ